MSTTNEKVWFAVEVEATAEAREAVEYALMEAGAMGTETNDTNVERPLVSGYFDALPNRENVRRELAEALRIYAQPSSSVTTVDLRTVANEDWLAEWKKNWQPVTTGRFVIAPPWSEVDEGDRIVIRIEPGMAFGTGTHETTRLCLMAIETHFQGGSFLDVGTGSGILAIAAAKLYAGARIHACDVDVEALEIARENATLNTVNDRIVFEPGSIDDSTPSADFVCANLTADVIIDLLPKLIGVTCGRLVLSGILQTQLDAVIDRLRECGVSAPIETTTDGEWAAVTI